MVCCATAMYRSWPGGIIPSMVIVSPALTSEAEMVAAALQIPVVVKTAINAIIIAGNKTFFIVNLLMVK
jgi:signal transduction protein with GAF and PtsI domain